MSEIHSSETPSAADEGRNDHQSLAPIDVVADAIIPTIYDYEVNMLNCYKHRQHLFNRCKDGIIHRDVLISFWIMCGGYVSPAESVDEVYKKGIRLLRDLIQGGLLKPSDEDPEMIELVGSTCRHGSSICYTTSVGFVEMLEVDRIENVLLADGMMKQRNCAPTGNYLSRQVFQSQRGLKYIAHFNPTPNSLNPLFETVNNPSVLMLRGFDDHLFPVRAFNFENLKTLIVLEISSSCILNINVPSLYPTISKLTQLRYLYLSDPLIDSLPADVLFSKLVELRWLILRGCSRLNFYYNLSHLRNLEVLDLSYTSTTKIPIRVPGNLTHLFLRDSALRKGQALKVSHSNLKFLDLSRNHIEWLAIRSEVSPQLVVLDLSRTEIRHMHFINRPRLHTLILMECTCLREFSWWESPTALEVLDVSGCENLQRLPKGLSSLKNMKELNLAGCSCLPNLREGFFDQMTCLVKLDLSETKFTSLPSFANLTSLRELKLKGLELHSLEVQTWTSLSNLAKLDLHGLKIITLEEINLDFLPSLLNLQALNLSKISVAKLPDISKLISLKELLLSDCWDLKALPDLQPLTSLETLDVSLPDDPTRSCQLVESEAQKVLPPSLRRLVLTNRPSVQSLFPRVPSSKKSENLQVQGTISKAIEFHIVHEVGYTGFDRFIYVFERIDALIMEIQRSSTRKTANTNNNQATYFERQFEMLHADMKYFKENIDRLNSSRDNKNGEELMRELVDAAIHLSAADFKDNSQNLKQLLRLFVRLKLLLPLTPTNEQEASKTRQKNKQPLFPKIEQIFSEISEELSVDEINNLHFTYQSLTSIQKNCLLYFSAFPCNEQVMESSVVKKRSLVIKKRILINWWVSEGFLEEEHFQDNGEQMLENLVKMGFIEHVIKERRKLASFRMHHHVHSFVTAQAKSESFFDFGGEKNNWLGPYFTRSNKDSLPKTQGNFSTCAKLWANHKNLPRELDRMRNVSTLFNVDGSMIAIKPEWLSKMRQLSTLSLGSWGTSENAKQIEIVDKKFLEELKSLKQLRFINLQGLMTIIKLPESICKLGNLIILDLRECGYLEELPAGIGSLRTLIHLDLTDCVLLNKMPKGISLLSKLEVLRGFKITPSRWEETMKGCMCVIHGKDNEVCSLKDLSNLEKLYKLSLVVKIEEFPSEGDLEVLTGMKRLRKLKIFWENSIDSNNASTESSTSISTRQHFNGFLGNDWELEKLELWCIPYQFLPGWLSSVEVEKLYIVGGDLVEFGFRKREDCPKTLRLKYLQKMRNVDGFTLKTYFKRITYMEIKECLFFSNSIWWNNGECIWNRDGARGGHGGSRHHLLIR